LVSAFYAPAHARAAVAELLGDLRVLELADDRAGGLRIHVGHEQRELRLRQPICRADDDADHGNEHCGEPDQLLGRERRREFLEMRDDLFWVHGSVNSPYMGIRMMS